MLRNAYAVRIWVDAPSGVRLARAVARDGEASRATWVDVWMPTEDRYVERDDPAACAHLVVDGGQEIDPARCAACAGTPSPASPTRQASIT